MQTLAIDTSILNTIPAPADGLFNDLDPSNRAASLKAVYRQLFKENRDFDFFHNSVVDSAYLNGRLTTRQLVLKLITSEMYRDYILCVNSNYRFVAICFERVLGRPATDTETRVWSSLLATEGLNGFAEQLVNSDEYSAAFGDHDIPTRRSQKLSSSHQGLPALPESESMKRYDGPGRINQFYGGDRSLLGWEGALPPKLVRQAGAVFAVAGTLEVARVLINVVTSALGAG
ncbi:MAG: phycobilisome Linker polypeptide [Cyanothece sp. SIO1E1]|nr:phycobilisome Linker polypeptide [Cyanothece sp. SIO1E1]